MRRFKDIDRLREDLKSFMPLDQLIGIIDNKPLQRVNDQLYKKSCDLNTHPQDEDGTRDSTPSFTVCPQKELWYCFGCGMGGDRFEYISLKLNLTHYESIEKCAEFMGYDISNYYDELSDEDLIIESLYNDNHIARELAHEKLLNTEHALNYLLGRGISLESIERFKLGYSDTYNQFTSIPNYITLKLDKHGQFLDAILFPVNNAYGRMRYFQSRPFNSEPGKKYIGGDSSHPLYNDSERIFGLDNMRKLLVQNKGVVVGVEGAPDAIVCNQHGILSIGFLGTVFNEATVELMDKFRVVELIMLLDGDKAGRTRSKQIAEKYLLMSNAKVRLKVANMPDSDPDEYINKYGVESLIENVISKAKYASQYLIDFVYEEINPSSPTSKIEFIDRINQYIIAVRDDVTRKILVEYIAKLIQLDPIEIEEYYISKSAKNDNNALYVPHEEEILLAEAIRNQDLLIELISRFNINDWYLSRHKKLFSILRTTEHTDVDTLYMIARNMGYSDVVTEEWLYRLRSISGNVEFCIKDVEDKLIRRNALQITDKLINSIKDTTRDPVVTIDMAISNIYRTTIKKSDQIFDAREQVDSAMSIIESRMANPVDVIGIGLGPNFKKLTQALLGLEPKAMTVVAANQSVGKTMICENWAMYQSVYEDVSVCWFSLEMDKDRMTFRHLSILSGIRMNDLRTGNITVEDKINVLDPVAVQYRNSPFYLSERGHDIDEAISIAKMHVMRHKVQIIYVDYIQLQNNPSRSRDGRHRELGSMSKIWKQFAKEMGVHVVLISQLSRDALSADTAEAEHGAGSYEIAQDADNYITLKEKSEDEIQARGIQHGNITINVSKNRMGEKSVLIDAYKDGPTQRFYEV